RDPLSLHLIHWQQRLGVRRVGEQYALLQLDWRLRDDHRALRLHRTGAGARWFAGEEEHCASWSWNYAHEQAALRRPAGRCDPDRRRAYLLSGVLPWRHRRAAVDARGQNVLKAGMSK